MTKNLIIPRPQGFTDWLAEQGITGEQVTKITRDFDLTGYTIIGSVPVGFAARAVAVRVVEFDNLPEGFLGGYDLTAREMKRYGAHLVTYRVIRAEE